MVHSHIVLRSVLSPFMSSKAVFPRTTYAPAGKGGTLPPYVLPKQTADQIIFAAAEATEAWLAAEESGDWSVIDADGVKFAVLDVVVEQ